MVGIILTEHRVVSVFFLARAHSLMYYYFLLIPLYRPGLLMCERQESRFGERCLRGLAGTIDGSGRFSISTENVAKAMVLNSLKNSPKKWETFEHAALLQLAKES